MTNICLLESAGFLSIRIEKLLASYGFTDTKSYKALINGSVDHTFANADLIILDIDSRNIKPVQVIEAIKNSPKIKDIPILLLSSHVDVSKLKQAITLGCFNFITKPFSDLFLMEKVHTLVKKQSILSPNRMVEETPADLKTNRFVWQEGYEIGIEEIDQEHKSIIDSYQELYDHMIAGDGIAYYNNIVHFLETYINEHFSHEEAFQAKIHYPHILEHKAYHTSFENRVQSIMDIQKDKEVTNTELIQLSIYLKDWLLHHILVEDAKIGAFFNKSRA